MTGCYTCGGGMGKHDPVAHDQVPDLFDAPTVPSCCDHHAGWADAPECDGGDEPCMCDTDFTCMATEHDPS